MGADDHDDERPASRKKAFEPKLLDSLSIAELDQYILELKDEILRTEQAIAAKRSVRAGADSLFGKKST